MIDWAAIKTEYITTGTSYRKLEAKYGINRAQIGKVGKDEGWVELRRQYVDNTLTKTLEEISRQQANRTARLLSVSDKLLLKIEATVDGEEALSEKGIRALTAALKDLKEIQSVRSELDEQEQKARIAKLQREAAVENHEDNRVEVVFIGAEEDWME